VPGGTWRANVHIAENVWIDETSAVQLPTTGELQRLPVTDRFGV
jgi:hypothetical protein